MRNCYSLKFQCLPLLKATFIILFIGLYCLDSLAAQEAIVIVDKAVIYSDIEMKSALGFIRRGKKIAVGDSSRNKGRVYPVVVSGKIGFIRTQDVTTEKDGIDSNRLVAERFQRLTEEKYTTKYGLSYFRFPSQISLERENGGLRDKDALTWHGLAFKGILDFKKFWAMEVLFNFMTATQPQEKFRALEIGIGASYLVFETGKLRTRLIGQILGIPYSSYSFEEDFRVNGYGFSLGSSLGLFYRLTSKWELESFAGLYYTQLRGFEAPAPYQSISPSFIGTRFGLGANYSF
jgi:hypothetical protein